MAFGSHTGYTLTLNQGTAVNIPKRLQWFLTGRHSRSAAEEAAIKISQVQGVESVVITQVLETAIGIARNGRIDR